MDDNERPSPPSMDAPDLHSAILIGVVIFVIGIVIVILQYCLSGSPDTMATVYGVGLSFAFAVASLVLSWACSLHSCVEANAQKLACWFASQQAYLIEIWAGKTPLSLTATTQRLPNDHSRWIVAKFMAKAIGGVFSESGNRIEIPEMSDKKYSELLASMIAECRIDIRMSCPLTPTKWFEHLKLDSCQSCLGPPCQLVQHINSNFSRVGFYDHIHALVGNHRVPKTRLVILNGNGNELEGLQEDKCYPAFYELAKHANLEQWYVKVLELDRTEHVAIWHGNNKERWKDVNLLDGIVVYWEPKTLKAEEGICDGSRNFKRRTPNFVGKTPSSPTRWPNSPNKSLAFPRTRRTRPSRHPPTSSSRPRAPPPAALAARADSPDTKGSLARRFAPTRLIVSNTTIRPSVHGAMRVPLSRPGRSRFIRSPNCVRIHLR